MDNISTSSGLSATFIGNEIIFISTKPLAAERSNPTGTWFAVNFVLG